MSEHPAYHDGYKDGYGHGHKDGKKGKEHALKHGGKAVEEEREERKRGGSVEEKLKKLNSPTSRPYNAQGSEVEHEAEEERQPRKSGVRLKKHVELEGAEKRARLDRPVARKSGGGVSSPFSAAHRVTSAPGRKTEASEE